MIWKLPHRGIQFPRRPLVMGIVNVNDDSFSGDGTLDIGEALGVAKAQAESGADVIDIGAESARTNREAVTVEEEVRRFSEFLKAWPDTVADASPRDADQLWPPVVSANTWRPEVVEEVLPLGVEFLNDMGGLPDDRNARLCADAGVSLLIMHTVGPPKMPQLEQRWTDVMAALEAFFEEKIELAVAAGMPVEALVLDPGIDFAKQRDDNLMIYQELDQLNHFGCPVLVPVSRKTVIGEVLDLPEATDRDAGTMACIAASARRGAAMVRVHDVAGAWQAIRVIGSLVP